MIEDLISLKSPPPPSKILEMVDRYQLVQLLGRGGMGEVYLAYDPICGRYLALKRIQERLLKHKNPRRRFIREARITSQLTHSAIIPIFSIQIQSDKVYYTMPYIEGITLRELLRETLVTARKGDELSLNTSLPNLLRIFLQVCRGISYAHAQGILHRDIKPENIMVGKYGEIFILDWGVAQPIQFQLYGNLEMPLEMPIEEEITPTVSHLESKSKNPPSFQTRSFHPSDRETIGNGRNLASLTIVGKVVGTMTYLSPERAIGQAATIQSDIYSLGVILYQILALKPPFKRKNLKHFQEHWKEEEWIDPSIVAPYRDVPPLLAEITKNALSPNPQDRYASVDLLIDKLSQYLDGCSQWNLISQIDPQKSEDWIFQENILLNSYRAFSHHLMTSDWGTLMISREGFRGNIKLETSFAAHPNNCGIGILLSIPSTPVPHLPTEGYLLWLSSVEEDATRLIRSGVEVQVSSIKPLQKGLQYHLRIEKIGDLLSVYLNNELICQHTSRLPLLGQQIGLLYRDKEFFISPLQISLATWNIQVSCLAIPDAFLLEGLYSKAIQEYRRIALSFPGSREARQAVFSAGLALIEEGEKTRDSQLQQQFYDQALEEFEALRSTSGAPLEYLGKALIYQKMKDSKEELKCFELACRRYTGHPLLNTLYEQITYRLYHNTYTDRIATYELIFLIAYQIPHLLNSHTLYDCLNQLVREWEPIWFLPQLRTIEEIRNDPLLFSCHLAIWLQKSYPLYDLLNRATTPQQISQIAISLLHAGAHSFLATHEKFGLLPKSLQLLSRLFELPTSDFYLHWIESITQDPSLLYQQLDYIIHYSMVHNQRLLLENIVLYCQQEYLVSLFPAQMHFDLYLAKLYLGHTLDLSSFSLSEENRYQDPLYFPYYCQLTIENKNAPLAIPPAPYPRISQLALQALAGNFGKLYESLWLQRAVAWEKYQLFLQLLVYAATQGNQALMEEYRLQLQQEPENE